MTTYRTLGITDEVTACDCCGKSNLKSTVAMESDAGDLVHFGSVCATRHSGRAAKVIRAEANAVLESKIEAARKEFGASSAEVACRAKLAEANAKRITPGAEFKAFVSDACKAADAVRRMIAEKYSLPVYYI